jgi:hypothetical protein
MRHKIVWTISVPRGLAILGLGDMPMRLKVMASVAEIGTIPTITVSATTVSATTVSTITVSTTTVSTTTVSATTVSATTVSTVPLSFGLRSNCHQGTHCYQSHDNSLHRIFILWDILDDSGNADRFVETFVGCPLIN